MDFYVRARNKVTKAFVESLLPSMIKQLNIQNCTKPLFVKVSKTDIEGNNDGQTAYIREFDSIVVIIKPQALERLGVTLAHEMVHVKQIAKGTLKTFNGQDFWRGKRVYAKTKYLYKPWEIEAFSKQELIFRRALESK